MKTDTKNVGTSALTPTEIWHISAEALHTPKYREIYVNVLKKIIKDTKSKILDTAAGSGFPSLDLYTSGFLNITCSDGDSNSINELQEKFSKIDSKIKNYKSLWQNIPETIDEKFDILLNVDNSFVYMDSWSRENLELSFDEMSLKMSELLKKFYYMLNDGGKCIIALTKTNKLGAADQKFHIGSCIYKGKNIDVTWSLKFDWNKRVKKWIDITLVDGKELIYSLESYLITREELAELVTKSGFKKVEIIEAEEGMYDDLLVGYK